MATGSSRFTHVSLGSLEDKINLNPRQLDLLKERRARLDGQVEKKILPVKPSFLRNQEQQDAEKNLELQHVVTASTTSVGSSVSEASSGSHSFYRQALPKHERKKMYDDTGASFYEGSSSEASGPSCVSSIDKLKPSATDLTDALTKTSSHGYGAPSELSSIKESVHGSTIQTDEKSHLKKRFLANMTEKRKRMSTSFASPENRRKSVGWKPPKTKGGLPDDQQRAFLKTLMQSAYTKPAEEDKESAKEPKETANYSSTPSVRSATSASSAASAEEKAIMRKVVERNRKKRASTEKPTKGNFKKADSKDGSPTSGTSGNGATDEKSTLSGPQGLLGRNTPRRNPKSRSPRFGSTVSRWVSAFGSNVDKEVVSKESSEQSNDTREAYSDDNVEIGNRKTEESNRQIIGKKGLSIETHTSVHVKPQMTEVSALSRKSLNELGEGPSFQSQALHHGMPFDDDATCGRFSVVSRPSVIHDHGVEVEVVETKHARAVLESLMEPVDLNSPSMSFGSPIPLDRSAPPTTQPDSEELGTLEEEDPEGYADFIATLKGEVSGSHSLLWESFNGLFREDTRPLSSDNRTVQFDKKTKAIVASMSSHLKKNPHVTCVSGTEIANDKSVRTKPVAKRPCFARRAVETEFEYEAEKENGITMHVPPPESINENPENNVTEVTLGHPPKRNAGVSGTSSTKKAPLKTPSSTKAPLKTPSSSRTLKSALKSGSFTPKNNTDSSVPWSIDKNGNDNSVPPWSGVKLRSVHDADKSEVTSASIPTSWAKVKLRPVTAKSENTKGFDGVSNVESIVNVADDASDFRRIIVSKKKIGTENEPKTPKSIQGPEVIEIIDLADVSSTIGQPIDLTTNGNPIDLTDRSNEDSPIDLTAAQTPRTVASHADTRATGITADGSVLVSLAPESNSEPVKVLIGKRGLVKIRTKFGETKAQVIWRHELEDIRSAMLDLASSKVKLLLHSSDDHKDLAFASPDACMRFANALHEQTHKSHDNEDEMEAISVEESLYVEQLNEEEQRVLEEFRHSKKHDPASTPEPIDTSFEKPMSVINADITNLHSPVSEISGPGAAVSSSELDIAQAYLKMLKLQIPKEAVRNKMEIDGVSSKVIDLVLGDEGIVSDPKTEQKVNTSGLTEGEEAVAAGFRKMLKMRIPPEAVRHKMEKEGVDLKIVNAVLGEHIPVPEPEEPIQPRVQSKAEASSLSATEEVVAAPYRKMLKMMIPKDAVAHNMAMDKVPNHIISAVVGLPADSGRVPSKVASVEPGIPVLTDEEAAVASAYQKMLSLRIPKEAVRQKMLSEGISNKIIAAVLKEKLTKDQNKGPSKRVKQGFHWKPLESSENLQNSVWSKASFDSSLLDDDVTIASHVEQFQKKVEVNDVPNASKNKGEAQKEKAKLIDLGRANNVAITLKAFGEFSHEELAQVIEFIDPFEKIKGDRALFMKDLLPASAEIKVIKGYTGDESRLVPVERWFRKIVHIKRIEEKIHVLRTMESFRNEAIALGDTFQQLTNVCNQVMSSDKLPDLLEMVRQIGNRMNNDSGEEAAGFKLDFLPRLAQTKGSDKKTTALDLVVMIFHTRNRREDLLLGDDFPGCYAASRLQIRELVADVKMLGGAIQKCKKELNLLVNENGVPPPRRRCFMDDAQSDSGVFNPPRTKDSDSVKTDVSRMHEELFARRSKLINSALDRGQAKQKAPSPRAAFLVAVANLEEKSYTYQGAINRVNRFMEEANLVFAELEAKRDRAFTACNELTEFFCEAGGEQNAPPLLSVLAEFAENLSKAVSKYDNQKMIDARRKANNQKKSKDEVVVAENNVKKEKTYCKAAQAEKKSLVLMVNEMLKVAGDKQRADFINGVVYDNPDSRLKQIYEAEKKIAKPSGSSPSRKNILRTIEERRTADDSRIALSELALAMQKRTLSTDSHSPTAQSTADSCESPAATDAPQEPEHGAGARRQLSIADRWTRKFDDETVAEELKFDPHDSDDRKFEDKKRQQYVGRWSNKSSIEETTNEANDLESDSDIGALLEYHNRSRQTYVNRWSRKPEDGDEEVESLSMSP